MKVIVPANNKGGVGKTSVSAIIGDFCANILKKRTLLIDLDSQCNLSQRTIQMDQDSSAPDVHLPPIHPDFDPEEDLNWDGRSSIADIFLKDGFGVVPYPTNSENLDIIPAHAKDLKEVELVRHSEIVPLIHNRFKEFLSLPDVQEAYDVVIIDTSPSKGPLTVSAIRAATDVIIPCVMEDKPVRGLYGMLQLWMQESLSRGDNDQINLVGILPNLFDSRTTLHRDFYEGLLGNPDIAKYVIPHKLSRRINFAEIDCDTASPKSVFQLPDDSKAKREALAVCEFIQRRVFNE